MRSWLYVPADQGRFIARAHERGADCIILDLEDAVPDERKDAARAGLAAAAKRLRQGTNRIAVRVNAGVAADLDAAIAAGIDWLVCPKADLALLDDLATCLKRAGASGLPVLATIESPAALLDAAAIARHPVVGAVNLGSEDFALALGGQPDPDVLLQPKLMVHYAAKAAGRLSLGLLRSIADYGDLEGLSLAARDARRHGFDGSTCVHPSAVPILNTAFAPSEADLAWAQAVMATKGTVSLDGQMIDKPLRERARAILRSAAPPPRT
jgi:citrate lyase subunit beta/citryl-CoA lyase